MTNTQLFLCIFIPTLIPTFAIVVSMFVNNGRFNTIESRLVSIEGDLRRFYQEQGRLAGHVESLEQRQR
jgi:hypothetical protein